MARRRLTVWCPECRIHHEPAGHTPPLVCANCGVVEHSDPWCTPATPAPARRPRTNLLTDKEVMT